MSKNNGKQDATNIKGYVVKESVLFSNHIGFALAENPKAVQPFVTWRFTEDEGKVNMFWGHYSSDRGHAAADFISRIGEHQKDYPYASIQAVDHLTGKRCPERFESVDLIASLNQIMERNTVFHRNDLGIDIASLLKSADSNNPEDKRFLWLSRPSGTEICTERMAYLRETRAHNTWRFYAEQSSDPILAYAVTVTGKQDGRLMGNLYELDYRQHVPSVVMQSVDVKSVEATFESGGTQSFSHHKLNEVLREHGDNVKELRYCASDSGHLESVLTTERERRQGLPLGQIDRHIQDLRAERIQQEAKRVLLGFRTVAAGFSNRDGGETDTQRFVEVSQHFRGLAEQDDMDRLRAALPFTSLNFSVPDGMQRQYAFISVEEKVPGKINQMVLSQAQPTSYPQVYMQSAEVAREAGKLNLYRASNQQDAACAAAIDQAVRVSHYDQYCYDTKTAAANVIKDFGIERVAWVLARDVQHRDYDGRFSHSNKEWAKGVSIPTGSRPTIVINTHPTILDDFIHQVRKAIESSREEPMHSLTNKLKAAKEQIAKEHPPNPSSDKPKEPSR